MRYLKRTLSVFLILSLLIVNVPMVVGATETTTTQEIIYLEDGTYLEVTISESVSRALNQKTGKKTYSHKNKNDELLWTVILTGEFTYDTASSVCTSADCKVMIANTAWYVISKTSVADKNTATADLTMGKKVAGIKVSEVSIDMKLTCDKNGNLS